MRQADRPCGAGARESAPLTTTLLHTVRRHAPAQEEDHMTPTNAVDPLFDADTLIPLGAAFLRAEPCAAAPSVIRPFGMRYAVVPRHVEAVQLSSLRYDTDRQVCIDSAGTPAFGRHTDGPTSTRTSDGHGGMDSDTDHRED
ncbi:putative ATP-grasp-modified RiPP [Pseudonocardia sp. NPDC046786]|uniref:putative ATP-grasp-modified RiPP n=1 Tax=Pseudonocardia sp. NPDC046786 TaxID=3155471 RepID=UPI0033E3E285